MDDFVSRNKGDMDSISSAASSPDPLNASMDSVMGSRRVTRSQTFRSSSRLSSVNPSPRKQIFSLDVGNESAPQKIRVTVEADDVDDADNRDNTSRRLFRARQSPTPKQPTRSVRGGTITKTVRLRGLTDDEAEPTPKRRGRPPKSATGTPVPSSKKKAPIRKTPARPRRTKMDQTETLTSDIGAEDNDPTPKPTAKSTRGTARKRRADSDATELAETPAPKKRGRPRKTVAAEPEPELEPVQESIEAPEVRTDNEGPDAGTNEHSSVAPSEGSSAGGGYAPMAPSDHGDDEEEDIWMATLSDPPVRYDRRKSPTPRPAADEQPPVLEGNADHEQTPSDAEMRLETEEPVSEAQDGYRGSEADYPTSDAPDRSGDKDTIMVGEEFTMISVGGLPSFQASMNMSMASASATAEQYDDIGEETGLIINGALESYRRSVNEALAQQPQEEDQEEEEVSFVGEEQPAPAEEDDVPTPRNNNKLLPSAPSRTRSWSKSPRRAKKPEDLGRKLALKSLQKEQVQSFQNPPAGSNFAAEPVLEPSGYEDSFSEIPEAVLEAATPRPFRRTVAEDLNDEEQEQELQQSIERQTRADTFNQQPDTADLLTPDDTPSPAMSDNNVDRETERASEGAGTQEQDVVAEEEGFEEEEIEDHEKAERQHGSDQEEEEIFEHEEMPEPEHLAEEEEMASSPPILNLRHHEQQPSSLRHARQLSSDTPFIQEQATQPPPKIGEDKAFKLAPPETASRQSFSPIVRAGRALQFVTSDPPSPPFGDNGLGSPFRSSLSKSPTTGTQPKATQQVSAQEPSRQLTMARPVAAPVVSTQQLPEVEQPARSNSPWSSAFAPFKQIRNVVAQAAQRFSPRAAPPPPPPATLDMSDPFVATSETNGKRDVATQDTLSMHNSMLSLGGGRFRRPEQNTHVSASSSVQVEEDVDMEDEMSWVADGAPVRVDEEPVSQSSSLRPNHGTLWDHDVSDMDVDMQSFVEPEEQEEDEQQEEEFQQEEEQEDFDDADLWDFEASRPTPAKPAPRMSTAQAPVLDPPRRGKLPSPWRQSSQRLVYNDERRIAAEDLVSEEADADEFGLMSQFGGRAGANTRPQKARIENVPAQQPKAGMDLSSFFSSPALLPETRPPFAPASNRPVDRYLAPAPAPATAPRQEEEEDFDPRPAPLNLWRNLFPHGSSVASSRPTIPQKRFEVGGDQARRDLFSPVRRPAPRFEVPDTEEPDLFSSPALPAQQKPLPVVPQKANFTPRLNRNANSLFNPTLQPGSLFARPAEPATDPTSEGGRTTVTTPERQTSPGQESSFVEPNLKPFPARQQSPTKSSFRSPLKAKTPGRVVVFASSTLSPLAQAQARAERRASQSPEKSSAAPPSRRTVDYNKENETLLPANDIDMSKGGFNTVRTSTNTTAQPSSLFNTAVPALPPPTTSSSSAIPKPKPPPSTTSYNVQLHPKTWTRDHWERLDALVQQRRRTGALNFQLAHPISKARNRHRHQADTPKRPKQLLGKQVVAQGETMLIEQWHLDVIDVFSAELGEECEWDGKYLMRRVFALLVGEERRRVAREKRRTGEVNVVA